MSEDTTAPGKKIRIVLVEDHLLTRIGLKTVIERDPDFSIIGEAENGEVAVKKVDELRPNVVLMDVGMPIMDGIEAAKQIKKKNSEVEIIMLTSHDNERDIFASLAAGASGYCLKDVEPERLYSAIRSVSSGDVWLDSNIANKVLKIYTSQKGGVAVGETARVSPATKQHPPLLDPLSPRELEVLGLLVDGMSNQEIADRLIISLATAKTHVRNILNKLAVDDRTQAAVQAMRRGLF